MGKIKYKKKIKKQKKGKTKENKIEFKCQLNRDTEFETEWKRDTEFELKNNIRV